MEDKIKKILKKYTGHEHIFLTPRGNKAIFAALKIVKEIYSKKNILIPDQSGWITYPQYAKKLKLGIKTLKTDYGVINLDILREEIKEVTAILYASPAGYYAQQPLKEIYELCKKNNVAVILDISGCIGSDFYRGNHADITVCSFGRWKPVNLEYGGLISIKDKDIFEESKNYLEKIEFDKKYYSSLYIKLVNLKKRYRFFEKINNKIKNELRQFNILHKDKLGINVLVKFRDKEEKNKIMRYCEKNKYEFVVCPKSFKVNENAISIEVKRLE